MKTKAIFLFAVSLFLVGFMTSCGDDDTESSVEATGISLDMESLSIEVEAVGTLVATLEPTGAGGDITWVSSDPTVAAVNNGIVTALSIGSTSIIAAHGVYTATCAVTVTAKELDPNDLPASLSGSNYSVIHIDETTFELISGKVDNDLRPDDVNSNLYIWESTFSAGTGSGLNYFGQSEGWISLVVANVGWSGGGFNIGEGFGLVDMTDMGTNPDDYNFHIAMKSAGTSPYILILSDGVVEVKINIGSDVFNDDGATYQPYVDFARDNEWHAVEIPVSYLVGLGLNFDTTFNDKNVLSFLAGGVSGTTLDMDAIFYYKKAN